MFLAKLSNIFVIHTACKKITGIKSERLEPTQRHTGNSFFCKLTGIGGRREHTTHRDDLWSMYVDVEVP